VTRRLVARRDGDGRLRVRAERLVAWRRAGAPPPEPEAVGEATEHDEIRLLLAEGGLGPTPVVSLSDDGEDGERRLHLTWPDAAVHRVDPELARVVALASTPIFDEVPELEGDSVPDLLEAAARQAEEDRDLRRAERRRRANDHTVAVFTRHMASRLMARKAESAPEPDKLGAPPRPKKQRRPRTRAYTRTASGATVEIPVPRLRGRARLRRR
jgi:hypothetical protein